MRVYIIIENNEQEYEDYDEWVYEIYIDKEKAENRFIELVKTNAYIKDRTISLKKYYKDVEEWGLVNIGAYRLEEHEVIK